MKRHILALIACILGGCAAPTEPPPTVTPSPTTTPSTDVTFENMTIEANGIEMHLVCGGQGTPTVVFEAGMGAPGTARSVWGRIPDNIRQETRVCLYDRAGLGRSEASDTTPRTGQVVAEELHTLLEAAGESGPYLLVGHSIGGIYVRSFYEAYPDEVAGLVLIDASHEDYIDVIEEYGSSEVYQQTLASYQPDGNPDRVDLAQTFKALRESRAEDEAPYSDLPVAVISRGIVEPDGRSEAERQAALNRWQNYQRDLATLSTEGTFVVAEQSGHIIQATEPDVIEAAILDMIEVTN